MARCRSWRYRNAEHSGHRPGTCRECWSPCRAKLTRAQRDAGIRRCDDCTEALLFSPEVAVRRSLLDEPDLPRDILVALTTDSSGPIAFAAARRLEEHDSAEPHSEHIAAAAAATTPAGVVIPRPVKERAKRERGSERNVWS